MHAVLQRRFGAVYLLSIAVVFIAVATRLALLLHSPTNGLSANDLAGTFSIGLAYDMVTASYFAIPLILYLLLLPERAYRSRTHSVLISVSFVALLYLLLFVAVSEWVFWDEFESRFNFIAVDYLVYTNEVLGNIWESYPVPTLLTVIGVATLVVFLLLRRSLRASGPATRLRHRLGEAAVLLAIPALTTFCIDASQANFSSNRYANELAGNGIYSFFAAYRNNEIDYTRYYALQNNERVFQHLRALVAEPDTRFTSTDTHDITRTITGRGPEKRLNVVLITVESLSAEFLGAYGSDRRISPHLDALARESLFFTHVYATGTRTDRGLESIALSVPPTAGRSLIKRPHNENLFSLGQVFREQGYRTEFLYGGYGYFDNMNYFFGNNGFKVVDRNSIAPEDIHFANTWGVADEDLFTQTLKEVDAAHAAREPFFGLVMTTSNHRPYTYPDGRIDIPSPGGRDGVVKYTDYAINDFIERARGKPWFDDTVFVVIADHCAKSAGKEALTVAQYHIPLLIYSPKHIAPGTVDRLVSQIDLAPTLLGLLNISYQSQFFGRDVLAPHQADAGRALLGNYQKLGYLKDGELAVLSPHQQIESYQIGAQDVQSRMAAANTARVDDAIAYYQGASLLFQQHGTQVH